MKGFICLAALAVSCNLFAGTIGGGSNPPALADESLKLSSDEFKSLAFDAINNPDMPIRVNGKLAKPVLIDLKTKIMRFESTDQSLIIDVGQQHPE